MKARCVWTVLLARIAALKQVGAITLVLNSDRYQRCAALQEIVAGIECCLAEL